MPAWPTLRQLDRTDRYVDRCRVRADFHSSRTRITFCIEQALRLTTLPGENQGRLYFFRKVVLRGISPRGSLQEWSQALQPVLCQLADQAIHGTDPRAPDADAVYFNSHQEALEILLTRTLRCETVDQWFWAQMYGDARNASRSHRVVDIVERLRETPASWIAVASAVMTALAHTDPLLLLTLLPLSTVTHWLRELEPRRLVPSRIRPPQLSQSATAIVWRSVESLGTTDPRVLWIASLVELQAAPFELASGTLVSRARATVRDFARGSAEAHSVSPANSLPTAPAYRPRVEGILAAGSRTRSQSMTSAITQQHTGARFDAVWRAKEDVASILSPAEATSAQFSQVTSLPANAPSVSLLEPVLPESTYCAILPETPAEQAVLPSASPESNLFEPADQLSSGEPTQAAGLYMLLNAMRRLGIAETLAAHPRAAEACLPARIMRCLARHAQVDTRDPVWRSIDSSLSQCLPDDAIVTGPKLYPSNLRAPLQAIVTADEVARVWSVAIRRWCWREAGITVSAVVNRDGWISLNRTDLDVTLSLHHVDIRIRRVGLDLDPGWLAWFGKVVRFHYVWDNTHVH